MPVWRDYLELPKERAMAIAGDPRRDRWVAGAVGGCETVEEAKAGALEQCQKRRLKRRLRAACVIYGINDEVVWKGP